MIKTVFSFCLLFLVHLVQAQIIASGVVVDDKEIPVANVKISESQTANHTYTNAKGEFVLFFFSETNTVVFENPAYQRLEFNIKAVDGLKVFLTALPNANTYNLDNVAGYTDFEIKNPNKRLENMPYFLGESDALRQLQMLPGVEHGTEVLSNLYVRGGNVDQNLVTYNGTPIYNYNHMFGVYSVFHHKSIHNTGLYAGIAPASRGGRLSSIIELESTKDAVYSGWHGELEVTPLNIGINIESINKDKSYFTLSGRRSWFDLLTPVENRNDGLYFNFYDFAVDFGFKLKDNQQLDFSFLNSKDLYSLGGVQEVDSINANPISVITELKWRNLIGSVKFSHRLNRVINAQHSIHYSDYKYNLNNKEEVFLFSGINPQSDQNLANGIKDIIARSNWNYVRNNKSKYTFGLQSNVRFMNVGLENNSAVNYSSAADYTEVIGETSIKPSIENALYAEVHHNLNSRLRFDGGIRNVLYMYDSYFKYAFEPRAHAYFQIDSISVLKFGYNRHNQFASQLNTGGAGDPSNIWVPSTETVAPQTSDIINAAYERRLGPKFSVTANAYFKQMRNLIQVDNFGEAIDPETDWQSEVFQGNGNAYGLELMAQANEGVVTGWVSYTLARSTREFPDLFADPFLSSFDRTHMAKLYANIEIGRFWSAGINALVGSGRMFTVPIGKFYDINNNLQLEYNTLNNFRAPIYNRIDLSVIRIRSYSTYSQQWKFYLYNATGGRNPLFISADFRDASYTNLQIETQYLAFIPGVAYSITF